MVAILVQSRRLSVAGMALVIWCTEQNFPVRPGQTAILFQKISRIIYCKGLLSLPIRIVIWASWFFHRVACFINMARFYRICGWRVSCCMVKRNAISSFFTRHLDTTNFCRRSCFERECWWIGYLNGLRFASLRIIWLNVRTKSRGS